MSTRIQVARLAQQQPGRTIVVPSPMRIGINYAWWNYGSDFGPPAFNWQPAAWQSRIDADLDLFVRLGIFAVRWFIFGDGRTYGRPTYYPYSGMPPGWGFNPPAALDPSFITHFTDLLSRCHQRGLKLVPCLLDFHWCENPPPDQAYLVTQPPRPGQFLGGARWDVITDTTKRTHFFDTVLSPLLAASQQFPDTIHAWDIFNEPEWCTVNGMDRWFFNWGNFPRIVPFADMLSFLREAVRLVNNAGFDSSVGFASHASLQRWGAVRLGITRPQFHYYGEPATIPPFDPNNPAMVGEIATAAHRPWSSIPSQGVFTRLRHLANLGYRETFLWSADARGNTLADTAVDWSPVTQRLVGLYTGTGGP